MDQPDVKRQLIDYLVENDGEDSIEMLVEGILRIVAAPAVEQPEQTALAKQRVEIVERIMKLPYIKATRDTETGPERFVARDDIITAVHNYAKESRDAAPAVSPGACNCESTRHLNIPCPVHSVVPAVSPDARNSEKHDFVEWVGSREGEDSCVLCERPKSEHAAEAQPCAEFLGPFRCEKLGEHVKHLFDSTGRRYSNDELTAAFVAGKKVGRDESHPAVSPDVPGCGCDPMHGFVCREHADKFLGTPVAASPSAVAQPDLSLILERDRTKVAQCVTAIKKVLEGYDWLINSRGCYSWDDDNWHKEFQKAHDAISEAIEPMVRIAADWSNCPKTWDEVQRARAAASPDVLARIDGLGKLVRSRAVEKQDSRLHAIADELNALREELSRSKP